MDAVPPDRQGGVPRIVDAIAGVLLALHAVLAWLVRAPALTTGNDDAVYLVLSRAIGMLRYHQLHLSGTPVEAQYPPLYPAFLALVSAVGGVQFDVLVAANIALSVIGLGLFYAAARRHFAIVAVLALALLVANPDLLKLTGTLHSEPLFIATTATALFLSARIDPSQRHLIGAAAAAIASALVRSAGVTVVAAVFLAWLFRRRFGAAAWLAAVGAITVGPWLAWTVMARPDVAGRSYISDALHAEPSTGQPIWRAALPHWTACPRMARRLWWSIVPPGRTRLVRRLLGGRTCDTCGRVGPV